MQRTDIKPPLRHDLTIGIVVSRFNELITERLLSGAVSALERLGIEAVRVAYAPGSFELPLLAKALAQSGVDGVVALGAVIRGQTDHYEHVAASSASGLLSVMLETGVPVGFGVLTCDTLEQALDRAGGKSGNKGAETAQAVVESATLMRELRPQA